MLPEWYKKGIPRVSDIVSYQYPFDENSEARFVSWLEWKGIKQKDYMNIATTRWTEIHLTMEHYMCWTEYVSPLYEYINNEIDWWKQWIDELKITYKLK